MYAIVIEERQLVRREVPDPVAGDGEVVVDVTRVSIRRRRGLRPIRALSVRV
jgi:NADPH:quinone reductase-like Zn-dependent oxidoreductase